MYENNIGNNIMLAGMFIIVDSTMAFANTSQVTPTPTGYPIWCGWSKPIMIRPLVSVQSV
jgi:hypothetical protein